MIELTPTVDDASKEPIYMQLYLYIRDEITAGRIQARAKLPSIRSLSLRLGLSRSPVALAYEQLLAEGYVTSKPRSGLFVAMLDISGLGERIADQPGEIQSGELKRAYHAAKHDPIQYDFGYGSVDVSRFPLAQWRRLMNRCLHADNSRLMLYGDLQGEAELRTEIAEYLYQNRGVRCRPEQIVVGAGTYHTLDLLFQLLQEDVSCIAAEEAVNDGVNALFRQFRFQLRSLRLERDGISMDDLLASDAQAAYVTPSHQFPYGMTLSASKRIKLLQWAKERSGYIIENDYDGEFRYSGRPIPSLQSVDEEGRVIYLGTFSKALTPAFRLSYMVLPDRLLGQFRRREHSYDQLASPIFQKTQQLFMASGDFGRHMRRMRKVYQKKRDALLHAVQQAWPADKVEVIGADSGMHLLLKVNNGMEEAELVRSAKQRGVGVYPTSAYALLPQPEADQSPTVLLGFGGLTEAEINAGVKLLADAWAAT
ncbi:PLP-dependent aminotransferase family protein [Paenibacillaceae bacterium]|nr:PLP-dependent aminotransferase family protein [Paenibacillaceae bacterium]